MEEANEIRGVNKGGESLKHELSLNVKIEQENGRVKFEVDARSKDI